MYLGASIFSKAGSFLLIPLITRHLTVEEYGDYAIAQTICAVLSIAVSFSLSSAIVRFYFSEKDQAEGERIAGGVARCLIAVAIGSALILQPVVWLAGASGPGVFGRWELSILLWGAAGGAIGAIPYTYLRAAERPIAAAFFQVAQIAFLVGWAVVLLVWMDRGLRGAIEAYSFTLILDGLVAIAFVWWKMPGEASIGLLRRAIAFTWPFVPNSAAGILQQFSDRWVLKLTGLQTALGGYALASQLIAPPGLILAAWNEAEMPRMGQHHREEALAGIGREYPRVRRQYLLIAAASVALLFCGLPFVPAIVGQDYGDVLWLVPLLSATVLFDALYFPAYNVLYYADATRIFPRVTLVTAVINVALNVALIPVIGVFGGVVARIAATAYRTGALTLAARKRLPRPPEGA